MEWCLLVEAVSFSENHFFSVSHSFFVEAVSIKIYFLAEAILIGRTHSAY